MDCLIELAVYMIAFLNPLLDAAVSIENIKNSCSKLSINPESVFFSCVGKIILQVSQTEIDDVPWLLCDSFVLYSVPPTILW
jgi:hypothetical protein